MQKQRKPQECFYFFLNSIIDLSSRKRLRRLLERQKVATAIKGDQIGESDNDGNSTGDTKTFTKTPAKTKAAVASKESMDAGSIGKKRKINKLEGDEDGWVEIKDEETELYKKGTD